MLQTLFHIPSEVAGVPVFGFGLLLAIWGFVSIGILLVQIRRHGFNSETLGWIPLVLLVAAAIAFVLPRMVPPGSPGLPIRGFGMMMLLAVIGAIGLTVHRARQAGLNPEVIMSLAFWVCLCGFVGARAFYVIQYWDEYEGASLFEILNPTQGGIVFYGAMLGGAVALLALIRQKRLPMLPTLDLIAPAVMVGLALGRAGCFLNGCCYGGLCELPWAVQFPQGSPPYMAQAREGQLYLHGLKFAEDVPGDSATIAEVQPGSPAEQAGLKPGERIVTINGIPTPSATAAQRALLGIYGAESRLEIRTASSLEPFQWSVPAASSRSLPVHPTQLYSVISATVICLFLLAYWPYRRRDGELSALLLMIYPVFRFLEEIIRSDEPAQFGTGLTISQNLSLGILLVGVGLWFYIRRSPQGSIWPLAPSG